MSIFSLNITSNPSDYKNIQEAIENLLSQENKFIVNFFKEGILTEKENSQDIIINAEYPLIGSILSNLSKKYENFSFGEYDIETIGYMKCSVVSLENS
jgi:hypothetical protein